MREKKKEGQRKGKGRGRGRGGKEGGVRKGQRGERREGKDGRAGQRMTTPCPVPTPSWADPDVTSAAPRARLSGKRSQLWFCCGFSGLTGREAHSVFYSFLKQTNKSSTSL